MPNVSLSPVFNAQVVKDNGDPAVGWKIATYLAGSTTPQPTYTDSSGTVAHTNPIIIDALGFVTMGELWIADGIAYKFVLSDENDVIKKTVDNIEGVNDATRFSISQWLPPSVVPTYVSSNSFVLADDQTDDFHVGRRLQARQSVSFVYGRITSSVFASGVTTVTLQMDAPGVLNNGLIEVRLSLLRADHHALPKIDYELNSLTVTGTITGGTISGLSAAIPIASGGTGLTSVGSSGQVLTSTGTAASWQTPVVQPAIGVGQTWQNPSRALNTQYTNTTSKPIQVTCCPRAQSTSNQVSAIVGGVTILNSYTIDCCGVSQISYFPLSFIVPEGSTYQVTGNLGFTVWAELR